MREDEPVSGREAQFDVIVQQLRALLQNSTDTEWNRLRAVAETASVLSPAEMSELILGARRVRNRLFGPRLFGEPAWDILLELHIAHHRGQAVSIGAASTLGDTPATTGLRWLTTLEKEA